MTIPPLQPVVPPQGEIAPTKPPDAGHRVACMNCETTLQSKYCHVCGQRKQRRVASVWALFGEFISETVDWDSRLWRTLWPLFFKPGKLTKAYMEGKRERYIPPFRLYLISSVVFFLVISFSPKAMFDDIGKAVDEQMGGRNQPISSQLDKSVMQSILEGAGLGEVTIDPDDEEDENSEISAYDVDLDDRDVIGVDDPVADERTTRPNDDSRPAESSVETVASKEAEDPSDSPTLEQASRTEPESTGTATITVSSTDTPADPTSTSPNSAVAGAIDENLDDDASSDSGQAASKTIREQCDQIKTAELGKWERLRPYFYNTCLSFSTWDGVLQFANELIDNLPKTLLILLPLMAFVNKFLYLFAGRYYVEHLLFYVHNFSFLFLFTLVMMALTGVIDFGFNTQVSDVIFPVSILYTIYYFIKSMRVVYGQGRFFTVVKWFILLITFFVMTLLVLTFLTLATAALHAL